MMVVLTVSKLFLGMRRHGMIVKIVMDWIMKPPFPTFGTSKSLKFLIGIHENFMNV